MINRLRGSRSKCLKADGASHVTLYVREAPRLNYYKPESARGPDKSESLHDKDGLSKKSEVGGPESNLDHLPQ